MEVLNKEIILTAKDLPLEEVEIPEWGGKLFVRTMTGLERDKYEADLVVANGARPGDVLRNMRARLVVLTTVDAKGERIFADADAEALGAKSSKALDRVADVATRLNGMNEKDVEDLAKNSGSGPTDTG